MSAKEKPSAAPAASPGSQSSDSKHSARGAASESPQAKATRGRNKGVGIIRAKADREPGQPLAHPRHEAFCQAIAEGLTAVSAYRREVSDECTYESAMQAASKLMADFNIRSRVDELRVSFEELLVKRLGVRQETLARYLLDVIETPVADVHKGHKLCQEYQYSEHQHGVNEKTKMPSKLEAVEKLVKMAGWNAPEKVEQKLTVEVIKL